MFAACSDGANAAEACPEASTQSVIFERATSGDGFIAADGSEIRLAGIVAPGSDGAPPERTQGARAALTERLSGLLLSLAFTGAERDRYGRLLVQLFAGGVWVQGWLLRDGLARAAPDMASAPCTDALLAAEEEARLALAGHWRDGIFQVLTPWRIVEEAQVFAGSFQIVEGQVLSAAVINGRAFLNFGEDYREDFTVTISPADMRNFRRAEFDPRELEGRRIRVRGWVELYNGPEFQIATPVAIEQLD